MAEITDEMRRMEMSEKLKGLSEPFPSGDIEWRVSRAGRDRQGNIFCMVLAYITARAISNRLDDVVGAGNWCNTPLQVSEVRVGVWAMQVGISIRIGDQWVTKFDVAESTDIEPAKGGFSGAMKRAGAQWGIGRYLYALSETFAETSENSEKGWEYARLSEKHGGGVYYWKPPILPAWALPSNEEHPVTLDDVIEIKKQWKKTFAPTEKNRSTLASGFQRFAHSVVGEFPVDDPSFWTQHILSDLRKRIESTKDPNGPSADVPFE